MSLTVTAEPGTAPLVIAFAAGDRSMSELMGGKGANLAEMTRLGLPVPHGFTITKPPAVTTSHSAGNLRTWVSWSTYTFISWNRRPVDGSAILRNPFWCQCVRVHDARCRG